MPVPDDAKAIAQEFIDFIRPKHPCAGAQTAFAQGTYRIGVYPSLDTDEALLGVLHDLNDFCRERATMKQPFTTFVAIFKGPNLKSKSEDDAAQLYWQKTSTLCALDRKHYPWTEEQINRLKTKDFRHHLGGEAWFPVWMHSQASRKARTFPYPTIVFNLQEQFDILRETPAGKHGETNRFSVLADNIRVRDSAYSQAHGGPATPNPNMKRNKPIDVYGVDDLPVFALLDGRDWTGKHVEHMQGPPDFQFLESDKEWGKLRLPAK